MSIQVKFPSNYKDHLRSGFPSLEMLCTPPETIKLIELQYKLTVTGNAKQLFQNYAKKYFTLRCEAYYKSPIRCLDTAIMAGEKEWAIEFSKREIKAYEDNDIVNLDLNLGRYLDSAIQSGDLQIIDWIDGLRKQYHFKYTNHIKMYIRDNNEMHPHFGLNIAVQSGHLHLVKYYEDQLEGVVIWQWFYENAYISGNLELIKYIETKERTFSMINVNLKDLMDRAIKEHHFHLIDHITSLGPTPGFFVSGYWFVEKFKKGVYYNIHFALFEALQAGRLDVVQKFEALAQKYKYSIDWADSSLLDSACQSYNIECMVYVIEKGKYTQKVINQMARANNCLELIPQLKSALRDNRRSFLSVKRTRRRV